jgi:hypothetical protein
MRRLIVLLIVLGAACARDTLQVDFNASAVTVAVDAFSGLPNPTFQLNANERAALEDRLKGVTRIDRRPPEGALGYRGFIIEHAAGRTYVGGGLIVVESDSQRRVYADQRMAEAYLIEIARQRGYGHILPR